MLVHKSEEKLKSLDYKMSIKAFRRVEKYFSNLYQPKNHRFFNTN